jgi:AAA15 family ATPase/GTPase
MNLKEFKFCRFKGETNEWSIEAKPQNGQFEQWFTLGNINLVVGKNATGKSRTINAIRHIADLVASDVKMSQLNLLGYGSAEYHLKFNDEGEEIEYHLEFKNGKITHETLSVDKSEKLDRTKGILWYEGAEQTLEFQTDDDVLAVSKRDKKQHSFFEKLYFWGKNLSHYRFGTQLGKNAFLRDINAIKDDKDIDLKDGDEVTEAFIKGKRQFPDSFINAIIRDMKSISYDIEKIDATPLKNFPIPGYGLNVKEVDLDDITDQREMSQGMFRAFSLLIQLNYSLLSKTPSCILIDDIGEGLDYDRSKSLIELIIQKVKGSSVQVIMTTNDRFVMNKVPLKYWSVIQRVPKKSLFYNYTNSRETFEEFKYTGMSNFDFLSSEFYIEDFEG